MKSKSKSSDSSTSKFESQESRSVGSLRLKIKRFFLDTDTTHKSVCTVHTMLQRKHLEF